MSSDTAGHRYEHFKRHHLLWITVRHFLSAPATKELCEALTDVASEGTIALEDLFIIDASLGPPTLASLAVWPKPVEGALPYYLQDYVRSLVWENDDPPFIDRNLGDGDAARARDLHAAAVLSSSDLSDIDDAFQGDGLADDLSALVALMVRLRLYVGGEQDGSNADVEAFAIEGVGAPLDALIIKHLGDLCAERDAWSWATRLYARADVLLSHPDTSWADLVASMKSMNAQSSAAALRALEGPGAAAVMLDTIVTSAEAGKDWVVSMNAPTDLLDALNSSATFTFPRDSRGSVLLPPQLLTTHHLSRGFERWSEKKFDDAHRWFWAVLRRQIALGSEFQARQTKGFLARCMIDAIASRIDRNRSAATFAHAVRLMLESGLGASADLASWSEEIVEAYVDDRQIADAVAHVHRTPGVREERSLVLIAALRSWLEVIPADRVASATLMLNEIARIASEGNWSRSKHRNVAAASFEALRGVAKSRPEFRQVAAVPVGNAITSVLPDGPFLDAEVVIETARLYADAFDQTKLEAVTGIVLSRVSGSGVDQGPLPLVQPALVYLHEVLPLLVGQPLAELREQVVSALLRVSAGHATESTGFMWLLGELQPEEVSRNVAPELIDTIVSQLCTRAMQNNSSAAAANISALLAAPDISGAAALRIALKGLLVILESATSGRPAISFADAYNALMMATRKMPALKAILGTENGDLAVFTAQAIDFLVRIWTRAAMDPLVFAGFAIPLPTTPNRTVVHNWTFASISFARSLGRAPEVDDALDAAATNPALQGPISVARAVEAPADEPSFMRPETIAEERRDAFYAGLGRRIVALPGVSADDRQKVLQALLDGCVRLGPQGEDAAVLTLAMTVMISPLGSTESYGRRLENDRKLRLTLGPLWRQVAGE